MFDFKIMLARDIILKPKDTDKSMTQVSIEKLYREVFFGKLYRKVKIKGKRET